MKNLKKMTDEQLKEALDKSDYKINTLKNLIYTAMILGMLSWAVAVGAWLFESTFVSNVFGVAGVLQSGAIIAFLNKAIASEKKNFEIKEEITLREQIAQETKGYQNSKEQSKTQENEYEDKSTSQTKDDDLTKRL